MNPERARCGGCSLIPIFISSYYSCDNVWIDNGSTTLSNGGFLGVIFGVGVNIAITLPFALGGRA